MKYYRIVATENGENILIRRATQREVITTEGKYINEGALDVPVKIEMHVGENAGYNQYTPGLTDEVEFVNFEDRLLDFYQLVPLMSKRLIDAFREAGVDNIQSFPVKIENIETKEVLNKEYLLVNVVGLISCANLEGTEYVNLGDAYDFIDLKIHKDKAKQLPLFRLAESPYEIIVNGRIANIINSEKYKGISAELVS